MFKLNANTMFNINMFNWMIISGMNEQMVRLYHAANALRGLNGQSALAKLLNVSPQTVNNWEDRGISNDGLLKAQEAVGCDAIWLRDGIGKMQPGNSEIEADEMIELIALYQQSTSRGREMILDLARSAAKHGTIRWVRSTSN
ncbi:hypothetical protein ACXX82_24285 [Glaciimonas sp. GNP009]